MRRWFFGRRLALCREPRRADAEEDWLRGTRNPNGVRLRIVSRRVRATSNPSPLGEMTAARLHNHFFVRAILGLRFFVVAIMGLRFYVGAILGLQLVVGVPA